MSISARIQSLTAVASLTLAVLACSDDDDDARQNADAGADAAAGGSTSGSGGSSGKSGSDAGTSGGNAGTGGGMAGMGGEAGEGSGALQLCLRFDRQTQAVNASTAVTEGYVLAAYNDCETSLFVSQRTPEELPDLLNYLASWNLSLWGCASVGTTTDFGLSYGITELTSTDAESLIDHYAMTTQIELDLSASEVAQLRTILQQRAEGAVTETSERRLLSECGTGGAGGAAGASGAAGSSGAAGASGSAGQGGAGGAP